jgi:hypothetical protein
MMISTFCSAILLFDGIDIFSQREKGEEERYFYISIYSPSPFSRQTCLCEREREEMTTFRMPQVFLAKAGCSQVMAPSLSTTALLLDGG